MFRYPSHYLAGIGFRFVRLSEINVLSIHLYLKHGLLLTSVVHHQPSLMGIFMSPLPQSRWHLTSEYFLEVLFIPSSGHHVSGIGTYICSRCPQWTCRSSISFLLGPRCSCLCSYISLWTYILCIPVCPHGQIPVLAQYFLQTVAPVEFSYLPWSCCSILP